MTPELSNVLAALAQKLGTSVEQLWPVLVARARFDAAMNITFCTLLGAAYVTFLVFATKALKKEEDWSDTNPVWPIGCLIGGIAFVVCLGCVFDGVTNLAYPEVAALKTILGK